MELRWTAHPAKRRPDQIALIAGVVLITSWAVMASLESGFLALLAAIILLIAVAPFLLPTHYRLDDSGVEARGILTRKFRRWEDLRRLQIGPGAALVSPFARPSWLDRQRGILLYFDGLDGAAREPVVAELKARLAPKDPA
jgi:hypothetical protein